MPPPCRTRSACPRCRRACSSSIRTWRWDLRATSTCCPIRSRPNSTWATPCSGSASPWPYWPPRSSSPSAAHADEPTPVATTAQPQPRHAGPDRRAVPRQCPGRGPAALFRLAAGGHAQPRRAAAAAGRPAPRRRAAPARRRRIRLATGRTHLAHRAGAGRRLRCTLRGTLAAAGQGVAPVRPPRRPRAHPVDRRGAARRGAQRGMAPARDRSGAARRAAAQRRSGRHPGLRGRPERIRDPAIPSGVRSGPPARGRGPPAQAQMMASPATVPSRPHVYRHFHRIAWLAVALTFCVIVFGAFVRLSDAGLSCPDWPTCYGRATWPQAAQDVSDHVASAIRPFETHKAWREQVHRHLAAALGVLVLVLALLAVRRRRRGIALVLGASALVAAAIPLYMRGLVLPALLVAGTGEALLLGAAVAWLRANGRGGGRDLAPVAALTLAVVVFQALLGKWTVTML